MDDAGGSDFNDCTIRRERQMEMIIGGAFQGKLEYARRQYPGREFLDGKECSLEMIKEAEGV